MHIFRSPTLLRLKCQRGYLIAALKLLVAGMLRNAQIAREVLYHLLLYVELTFATSFYNVFRLPIYTYTVACATGEVKTRRVVWEDY
jgi:hypothetical protein